MKKICLFCLILMATVFSNNVMAQMKVIYPNVNKQGENMFGYSALKLALENSGKNFELHITEAGVNDARIRRMLRSKEISIADFGTSAEFEQEFYPIYFPIDLGLNGWRIFLIHKESRSQFEKINSIERLRTKKSGQGIGWADVEILENAGLEVVKSSHIENLIRMVEGKRFDFFPLGANEAHSLLDAYSEENPNVIVEPTLLLIYPFGRLFFVHKENKELHDTVQTGLIKSFENGSFWELFQSHPSNQALFEKANLKYRNQILIDNPHMTEEFKKIPQKYFFTLRMLD